MNDATRKYNPGVFRGLGKPEVVLSAWEDALESIPELADDIREIKRRLLPILEMPDTSRIAYSLACAILNRRYLDNGCEHQCNERGDVGFAFEESPELRALKWHGLINLDIPAA
jgi:hypothetical protein